MQIDENINQETNCQKVSEIIIDHKDNIEVEEFKKFINNNNDVHDFFDYLINKY